jgi:hypothetical protein
VNIDQLFFFFFNAARAIKVSEKGGEKVALFLHETAL